MSKPVRSFRHIFIARATACALGIVVLLSACGSSPAEQPPLAGMKIGAPFTLVGQGGSTVRWDDFKGKWRMVYFGYTFCPDACPTDVSVMMRGFDRFASEYSELATQIQPIFISIDPARDTPARVGEFAAAFSPRLIGLTGTPAAVDQAAKSFFAYYAQGEKTPGGGYLMDHSRIAYLMDRNGLPIAMLPVDKGPEAVAAELAKWVK